MTEIVKILGKRDIRGTLHSVPLEWYRPPVSSSSSSPSPKLVRVVDDPKFQQNLAFKTVLVTGMLALVMLQGAEQFHRAKTGDKEDKSENVLNWLHISCLITDTCYLHMYPRKAPEMAAFITGLIQFDSLHPKAVQRFRKRPLLEMLSFCMAYTALLSQTWIPLAFVFGLHWQNPHRASLAGYWLIPTGGTATTGLLIDGVLFAWKLVVFLCNYFIWLIVMPGAIFTLAVIHSLAVLSLLDNISGFGQLCRADRIPRGQFIYARAYMWRHIQVLTGLLNAVQRDMILVTTSATIFIWSGALTSLVRSSSDAGVPFVATMMLVLLNCSLIMFAAFGGMAAVHERSAKILKKAQRQGKRGKWEQKFYRSCPPLKVMLGSNNFVDALMPLNSLQFAMSLNANFLLMTASNS